MATTQQQSCFTETARHQLQALGLDARLALRELIEETQMVLLIVKQGDRPGVRHMETVEQAWGELGDMFYLSSDDVED